MHAFNNFPYVLEDVDGLVYGDVYLIDEKTESFIDKLEGIDVGIYVKKYTKEGYIIYVGNNRFMHIYGISVPVESGDWIIFKNYQAPYYIENQDLV
jgi:gamma-glutamylcyclotransferase (GGCT)/AIG2-like uncharacterized protein YtfP